MNGENTPKYSHNTQHDEDKAALVARHIFEGTTFETRDSCRRTKRATPSSAFTPSGDLGWSSRCLSSGVALGCCLSVYLYPRDLLTPRENTPVWAENTSRNFLALFSFLRRTFFMRARIWVLNVRYEGCVEIGLTLYEFKILLLY